MKKAVIILLLVVLFIVSAAGGFLAYESYLLSKIPPVADSAEALMQEALKKVPTTEAKTPEGKALKEAIVNSWSFELLDSYREKRDALQRMNITYLDINSLNTGLQENAQAYLANCVENAKLSSEVYNEDLNFKKEVLDAAASEAFGLALKDAGTKESLIELPLKYEDENWEADGTEGIEYIYSILWPADFDCDAAAEEILKKAVENPQYIRKTYTIEETAKKGPEPDRTKFGSTSDPAVIEALLETPIAKQLIGDRKLAWNKDIELIPDTQIHYYLDETILSIVWQEEEALAVGTFAETIVADASQLRRKIAGDTYQNYSHTTASEFAKQTNAVLAVGGDLYHHNARNCGIMVYEREIYRFEPNTCDTCYITADGDMLFSYRGQFKEVSEAEKFVEENDVLFSLCFGPALIDEGKDVTPYMYTWGEVLDTYARSALGMLGDKHYLTMNINCKLPNNYYLATLRQAADAMIAKGCVKAYALDGGQTATTVFNNQLINPVQFGWEREISDIIYFATALPN